MKVFELVPQGTLAKQDLGTSYGSFSKFPPSTPWFYYVGVPLPQATMIRYSTLTPRNFVFLSIDL